MYNASSVARLALFVFTTTIPISLSDKGKLEAALLSFLSNLGHTLNNTSANTLFNAFKSVKAG